VIGRVWQRRLGLGLLIAAFSIARAEAHPHVWIDYDLTVDFDAGKMTALHMEWSFDEDFTAAVLRDIVGDKKPPKTLKPADVAKIEKDAFSNLKNYGYFTHIFAGDGKLLAGPLVGEDRTATGAAPSEAEAMKNTERSFQTKQLGEVKDFQAKLAGAKLIYTFTLMLAQPVDTKLGPIGIGVWDDTYYVDVGPAEGHDPKLIGAGATSCKALIVSDHQHPIYFGSVFPKVVRVTC
jgi:ABC-type uncharacterized transport system substrate-binding protein